MFDTNLVVVGNVLVAPEWRRLEGSGSMVANFRVASNARKFDRETNTWVDGRSLRVRVTAWRRLAEGVTASIAVGDPVIVYGRLFTRDWKDSEGNDRISYEMEALSIGHDLARGRSRFVRNPRGSAQGVSTIEDTDERFFIGGEQSAPVAVEDAPAIFGDGVPDEDGPLFPEAAPSDEAASRSDHKEEASDEEIALEVEKIAAAEPAPARRSRRTARKEPVAA
ncbi:single-stranded DNA-binding protein [Paractinoplanes maris]|uniref:single-stranded DNA-binding protein n=1 Tax=Paractinoplanes maris TaxID=1734446 RepID=UPI002021DCAC|nr:single-stranded DNA-binding protein [Actinoplanes maris]